MSKCVLELWLICLRLNFVFLYAFRLKCNCIEFNSLFIFIEQTSIIAENKYGFKYSFNFD